MRLIFTNIIMQHTSQFKSLLLSPRSSGTTALSPWRQEDPALTLAKQWKSVTLQLTSKLFFSICNVPWMELFIWFCSTEANHCFKTSARVTCGSYLSLKQPDTSHPPPPTPHSQTKRQNPRFTPRGGLILCRHSPPAPGGDDRGSHPRCWKRHRQITTRQRIWHRQSIGPARTRLSTLTCFC